MSQKEKQNESHDWLADAAESLVRYYFAGKGFYVYGAGKWGADCVLQNKKTGEMLTVEVKSTDSNRTHAYLVRSLKKQIRRRKIKIKARPDIYVEVRLERATKDDNDFSEDYTVKIERWSINKKKITLVDPAKS